MITTSANVANAIVKLVAADALPALVGEFVMGNLVNRDYEPTLAQVGDTVTVGDSDIVLNTHAKATFQIPDVMKVLAVPDLLRVYMQSAVVAIAEKIETDLLNLYAGFLANDPLNSGELSESVIDQAETSLFVSGTPTKSAKFLIVGSRTYSEMRKMHKFKEYYGPIEAGLIDAADLSTISALKRVLIDGPIGKIGDFFILRSRNIPKGRNLAFSKDAIRMVIRRMPQPLPGTGAIAEYAELGNFGMRVTMSYQPNTLSQQFTIDVLYGCAILKNKFAVQINTGKPHDVDGCDDPDCMACNGLPSALSLKDQALLTANALRNIADRIAVIYRSSGGEIDRALRSHAADLERSVNGQNVRKNLRTNIRFS